jgi:hypothetical protein
MKSVQSLTHASCVALILVVASTMLHAQTVARTAQPVAPPASAAAANPAKPAHGSEGLVFAINSIRVNRESLFIQYAVQNTTNQRQYIILYGSGSASTDNGLFGRIRWVVGTPIVNGIAYCAMDSGDDSKALQDCRAGTGFNHNGGGSNIENFTYIEPGDIAEASMAYNFNDASALQQAKATSFKFMALVRTASSSQDALSDPGKTASPPRVVNINFAFVPLQN